MSAHYYRLLSGIAASLSLIVAACDPNWPNTYTPSPTPATVPAARAAPVAAPAALVAAPATSVAQSADTMDTEATLWTVLGLAKKESERQIGPQTGNMVSPILWQATEDSLQFAGFASEDPMAGLLMTNWYSPSGKPYERLRVSVFIKSRALRSDSIAVSVERQTGAAGGQWTDAPVSRDVVTGLENAILLRARQIHAERYRETMYK
jgi:hypothetical protein